MKTQDNNNSSSIVSDGEISLVIDTNPEEKFLAPDNRAERRSALGPNQGIQHILICLDGSPSSARCIPQALSLAKTFESRVTLMHVMQHDDRNGLHTTNALDWELSRQEARARLDRLEKDAATTLGREVGVCLEQGRPAERIVAVSLELGADLVVLGRHDERERPPWKLGGTAQQVLAAARSSVLIFGGNAPLSFPPKRILVPLDGSQRTESVLPTAERLARAYGAKIELVHVVAEPVPTRVLTAPDDLRMARTLTIHLKDQALQYLETLRRHSGYDESLVETCVAEHTDERQFLAELAEREHIDLIVLSAHGSTCNTARPFGSVTGHLLTHSKVPILVVQDLQKCTGAGAEHNEGRAPLNGTNPVESI